MLRNNKNKQIPSYEFMLLDNDKYTFLLFLYTVLYQHVYNVYMHHLISLVIGYCRQGACQQCQPLYTCIYDPWF